MKWKPLRDIGWPLLFNVVAVFVCGNAAITPLMYHAFSWVAVVALIACAYVVGGVLIVARHRFAEPVNHRFRVGGIYLFAALTTALTVDDLMYNADAGGHAFSGWPRVLLNTSLIGSLVLGVAFLIFMFTPRYGHIPALVGVGLSMPYFTYLAWNLPWRDLVWLVTIHWDGELQVAAVISLAAALACSVFQLSRSKQPSVTLNPTEQK